VGPTQTALKPRQRNADRSAATREKILAATIACLHELGYHQTTTVIVTERAGVSRGAMLHHFPSKADLMIAAMDYIARNMSAAHAAGLAPIRDERARFAALVDILWAEYVKPVGVARIELILASRSDPVCGPHFAGLILELDQRHKDVVWPLARRLGFTERAQVDAIVQVYAAAIRGLAIDHLQPGMCAGAEAAVALLRQAMLDWADAARR
jgi:AcrR family transcriptional regulator